MEILHFFYSKRASSPAGNEVETKKLEIVLPMVILGFGYPSPQLHQSLKPMRELFCTGYPKRGRIFSALLDALFFSPSFFLCAPALRRHFFSKRKFPRKWAYLLTWIRRDWHRSFGSRRLQFTLYQFLHFFAELGVWCTP